MSSVLSFLHTHTFSASLFTAPVASLSLYMHIVSSLGYRVLVLVYFDRLVDLYF